MQALMPKDPLQRVELCETLLNRSQEDPSFLSQIIWSDETKFPFRF